MTGDAAVDRALPLPSVEETAETMWRVSYQTLRDELLEAFGSDDVAAIARAFDKGAAALSELHGSSSDRSVG